MPRPDFPRTVLEFQHRFATEEACLEYLSDSRWPEGPTYEGLAAIVKGSTEWARPNAPRRRSRA